MSRPGASPARLSRPGNFPASTISATMSGPVCCHNRRRQLKSSAGSSKGHRHERTRSVAISRAGAGRSAWRRARFLQRDDPRGRFGRRPEIDADPESIRDLAYSIIRVLDRDGEAVGPWAGSLTDEELAEGLRHMMTLRAFDARMQMAQRQGKTSFYMQHMGEEAVSCAFRRALAARRHEFPDLSPGGPADRRRLSDGRDDEPDLLERGATRSRAGSCR